MTNDEIRKWYGGRVPLSGALSDYAILIGQNNRVLQSKQTILTADNSNAVRANRNRVFIGFTLSVSIPTAAVNATIVAKNAAGTTIWEHDIFDKAVDTAAVTPSPFVYVPIFLNVKDWGDLVQQTFGVLGITGVGACVISETTFVPSCCEYIGGAEEGSFEPLNNPNTRKEVFRPIRER